MLSEPTRDRAVSTLIGFILLFGIAIISFSIYQAEHIPNQNEQIEFDHNKEVQSEVLNVRDSALRTGTTGVQQSTTVTVGADYPSRTFAINPSLSGGRIQLRDTAPGNSNTLYIRNAKATDTETADYFDSNVTISTKSIEYHPEYSHYHGAPDTVITGGAAAAINEFPDTNFSIADQVLVDGRTITIVAFNGSLDTGRAGQGSSVTVETKGLSVSERSITVRNTSHPINLTIPSQIDNTSVWNQSSLTDEHTSGQVINVTQISQNYIRVFLETGTYTLRMMRVGFGSGTVDPPPKYITNVDTPKTVPEETSTKLTYEVRDRFNNPKDGIQVNASILNSAGGSGTERLSVVGEDDVNQTAGDPVTANTSNGQVTLNYTAANVTGNPTVTLNITIQNNSTNRERVITTFSVTDNDVSGGGGGGGGGGSGFIGGNQANCATNISASASGASGQEAVKFDVTNDASCETVNITSFEISKISDRDIDRISRHPDRTHGMKVVAYNGSGTIGFADSANPNTEGFKFTDGPVTLDSFAKIGTDQTVQINFGYFYKQKPSSGSILKLTYETRSTSTNADYSFKIGFSDGTTTTIFIEMTSVDS